MKNELLREWDDVLKVNTKSVTVHGALKIGEAKSLHYDLTQAGYKPAGKRTVYNNGEMVYSRYLNPVAA